MERYLAIRDSHTRQCSALSFNSAKREIVAGYEDGTLKGFDMDSGNTSQTQPTAHVGMINCLLYWADSRLMLSAGNDGVIAAWLPSGSCFGRIRLYKAIYSLAINSRKRHLLVGLARTMRIYELEEGEDNKFVKLPAIWEMEDHDDIVKCISCYEGRVYTASFDGYICVYESTIVTTSKATVPGSTRSLTAKYGGKSSGKRWSTASPTRGSSDFMHVAPLERIDKKRAHDAGIISMSVLRDNEANVWVFTGSFDKSLKIWNRDCKLVHQIVGFVGPIFGICYVQKTRSLWAVSGSSQVSVYEPKSGDNISEYISAAARTGEDPEEEDFSPLHLLTSTQEYGCVYASTYDKGIIGWKYQPDGCLTCIRSRYPLEAITFTSKTPILIFTGDQRGLITKWERMEINQYLYTKEDLKVAERERKEKVKRRPAAEIAASTGQTNILLNNPKVDSPGGAKQLDLSASATSLATISTPATGRGDAESSRASSRANKSALPGERPNTTSSNRPKTSAGSERSFIGRAFGKGGITNLSQRTGITDLIYIEELDYIIAAAEDNNIYVWGFDPDACRALADLQRQAARRDQDDVEKISFKRFLDFLHVSDKETKSVDVPEAVVNAESMGVTNRVAGYTLLAILAEHVDCVTSLAVVPHADGFGSTFMLSGGWDRTICVWNIEQFILAQVDPVASVENPFQKSGGVSSDGVVTSIEYCSKLKQFAYASSDANAYVHEFSTKARHMALKYSLIGHTAEVTCIKWNFANEKWITSSEDGNIKIWDTKGVCVQNLYCTDPVTTLCIDQINGCIVAGVDRTIRVYDVYEYKLVQTNTGHSDQIRSIIHLPEPRNQYVSCGWDRTLRIWNTVRLSSRQQQLAQQRLQQNGHAQGKLQPPPSADSNSGDELDVDDNKLRKKNQLDDSSISF